MRSADPAAPCASYEEAMRAGTRAEHDLAMECLNGYLGNLSPSESPWRLAQAYCRRGYYNNYLRRSAAAISDVTTSLGYLDQPHCRLIRVSAYLQDGNLDAATADVERVAAQRVHESSVSYLRGKILMARGRLDEALLALDLAIARDASQPAFFHARGMVLHDLGRHAEALDSFTSSIALAPDRYHSYGSRGATHARLRQHEKAIADLDRAIERKPHYYVLYFNRAAIKFNARQPARAIDDFTKVLELNPAYYMAYFHRGESHLATKAYQPGMQDFDRALGLAPLDDANIRNALAWILATSPVPEVRDGRKALALATEASNLSSWKNAHHLDTLAAAYAEVGDFDEAVRIQDLALTLAAAASKAGYHERRALYAARQPYRAPPSSTADVVPSTDDAGEP